MPEVHFLEMTSRSQWKPTKSGKWTWHFFQLPLADSQIRRLEAANDELTENPHEPLEPNGSRAQLKATRKEYAAARQGIS
jgi:hypothetical protein